MASKRNSFVQSLILLLACCGVPDGTDTAIGALSGEPDAATPAGPWTRHTITRAGVKGADGVALGDVDGDGRVDVASPWEEGGGVTLSLHPADARGAAEWPTVRLGALHPGKADTTYTTGYEDAMIADVDGDGHPDVVGACECGKVTVWFAPADPAQLLRETAWTQVNLVSGSARHFMQLAFADLDGAGHGEVIVGTRVDPAVIGYWTTPASPRTASAWAATFRVIGAAGWTMSLVARDVDGDGDVDLIVSDRAAIAATNWALFGTRWLENAGGGVWTNHPIAGTQHNGSPKFLWIGDYDGDGRTAIVEPRGDNSTTTGGAAFPNTVRVLRNAAANWSGAWSTQVLGDGPDVGTVQSVAAGDLDGDGVLDLAIGYSYGHDPAQPGYRDATATNLAWFPGGAMAAQRPLVGTAGVKLDNTVLADMDGDGDLDVVQSEQGDAATCATCSPATPTPPAEQLGVFWLENPAR